MNHAGNAPDYAPDQDGETAYVKERQHGQPLVVIVNSQLEAGANSTPPVIAIGKHRTLRPARCAGRENDGMYRRQVNVVGAGGFIGAEFPRPS